MRQVTLRYKDSRLICKGQTVDVVGKSLFIVKITRHTIERCILQEGLSVASSGTHELVSPGLGSKQCATIAQDISEYDSNPHYQPLHYI